MNLQTSKDDPPENLLPEAFPEAFVVPEEERVGKALHSDAYFALIRRLSHQIGGEAFRCVRGH